jgi:hypothetical protein
MNIVYNKGYFYVPVQKPSLQIPIESADELEQNKFERDGHEWHITVVGAREISQAIKQIKVQNPELSKKQAKERIKNIIINNFKENVKTSPTYKGVGVVEDEDNAAYFVVVDWPEMQNVRHNIGLDDKDFHVTLGFKIKDIHGVSKDDSTLINEDILRAFFRNILENKDDEESDEEKAKAEKKDKMKGLTLRAYWDQLYD